MRISDWSSDVCSSDLQIRHLSLQQFLIGVPVSLLELEAHGQAIFGGSPSVANNGIVSLDRVCPVILVEDIATPAADRPAALKRFHAKPRGNERAAIHHVEILVRVGDGQNDPPFPFLGNRRPTGLVHLPPRTPYARA